MNDAGMGSKSLSPEPQAPADQEDPGFTLLEALYEHFPIIALGNAVLAAANLVAYFSKLPFGGLATYASGVSFVIGLRLLLFRNYRRSSVSRWSLAQHSLIIQLLSFANGVVWGSWAWYASTLLPAEDLLAMVVVQAGICAGVVSTSSASRLGLALFVVAALAPLSVHQFVYGGPGGAIVASVIVLYLLLVIAASNRIYRTIHNSIELAHKNRTLADQLYHYSNTDGLTGIANRRFLDTSLETMMGLHSRRGLEFSLLLIDVDDFKAYNDSKGHLAGDECLKTIAELAQAVFARKEDLVARYGGEEFAVLLPGMDAAKAMEIAETFRQRIWDLNLPHERSTNRARVTVSIGIADTSDEHYATPEFLIASADRALYGAKRKGKNQVRRSRG
ncbi:MAG: GGDEF domain-containing protein [Pseudomonadota bacterium]